MRETYQSAPVLKWMGQPFNGKGTYSETNTEGYYFYQSAQELTTYILSILSGKHGNLLKLMWILLGTQEGFGLSEKFITDRTGMTQQRYSEARRMLHEVGWIIYSKERHTITLRYQTLWEKAEHLKRLTNAHDRKEWIQKERKTFDERLRSLARYKEYLRQNKKMTSTPIDDDTAEDWLLPATPKTKVKPYDWED